MIIKRFLGGMAEWSKFSDSIKYQIPDLIFCYGKSGSVIFQTLICYSVIQLQNIKQTLNYIYQPSSINKSIYMKFTSKLGD